MERHSPLPSFGNWENEEDVPYTAVFEKARKNKGSGLNEAKPENTNDIEVIKSKDEGKTSPEYKSIDIPIDSPSPKNELTPQHQGVLKSPKRINRQSHGGKGNGAPSPSRERISAEISGGIHGLAHSGPSKSRLKSVPHADEMGDQSASVPRFGEWDESNPSSSDGYSAIFNQVREQRQGGILGLSNDPSNSHVQRRCTKRGSKKCCCFPWGGN